MASESTRNKGVAIKGIIKSNIQADPKLSAQAPIVTLDENTCPMDENDDDILDYEEYMNKVKEDNHIETEDFDDSDLSDSNENNKLMVPGIKVTLVRRGAINKQTNYKAEAKYVILDIGGERFRANRESFLPFPETRLGKLMNSSDIKDILQYCDEFFPGDPPEFFFDYNPDSFPGILEMYRTGKFHIPDGGRQCAFVIRRDFIFWGLDELNLEACCALKYYPQIGVCQAQKDGDEEEKQKEIEMYDAEKFDNSKFGRLR